MKKIIISDCDGILTNGTSIYTSDGKIGKIYGSYDTEAIKTAVDKGIEFLFVSTDMNGWNITKKRLDEYKARGWCDYKIANAEERKNLVLEYKDKGYYVIFVGDSISDIPAGKASDFFATTSNAWDSIKEDTDFISWRKGGNGGFAEIIYYILEEVLDNS